MRLAGQSKAGFYPTPERVSDLIASCLSSRGPSTLLDPCCGEGRAARRLGDRLGAQTWGIELSKDRAETAKEHVHSLLHGNALTARADGEAGFGLLYLNPPYDSGDRERLETRFLYHFKDLLEPGGVLVFVVSETYMETWANALTPYFENCQVYRFPAEEYAAFKQVVIFGTRRRSTGFPAPLPEPEPLSPACCRYLVPSTPPPYLYLANHDPQELYQLARTSPVWAELWRTLRSDDRAQFQPLLPLRKGHLALLVSAGLLNGCVVEAQGRRLLVKGSVTKSLKVAVATVGTGSAQRSKRTERDVFVTTVRALDLSSGELIRIGDAPPALPEDPSDHDDRSAPC